MRRVFHCILPADQVHALYNRSHSAAASVHTHVRRINHSINHNYWNKWIMLKHCVVDSQFLLFIYFTICIIIFYEHSKKTSFPIHFKCERQNTKLVLSSHGLRIYLRSDDTPQSDANLMINEYSVFKEQCYVDEDC